VSRPIRRRPADDVIIALDGTRWRHRASRAWCPRAGGQAVRPRDARGQQKEMDVTIGRYKERERPTG
jgi:hypothetical protein